jgi:hypothetical protein
MGFIKSSWGTSTISKFLFPSTTQRPPKTGTGLSP